MLAVLVARSTCLGMQKRGWVISTFADQLYKGLVSLSPLFD